MVHRFLCHIAGPVLLAEIDAQDSMAEVVRIISDPDYGFALLAIRDGFLVGTLGVVKVKWWFNHKAFFMTDRWFFCIDDAKNTGVGQALKAEADAIASDAGTNLIINGKLKKGGRAVFHTLPDVKAHGPMLGPDGRPMN